METHVYYNPLTGLILVSVWTWPHSWAEPEPVCLGRKTLNQTDPDFSGTWGSHMLHYLMTPHFIWCHYFQQVVCTLMQSYF